MKTFIVEAVISAPYEHLGYWWIDVAYNSDQTTSLRFSSHSQVTEEVKRGMVGKEYSHESKFL